MIFGLYVREVIKMLQTSPQTEHERRSHTYSALQELFISALKVHSTNNSNFRLWRTQI